MVRPSLRSRTKKRISKKTPGGKTVIHYEQRKPKVAHCALCKKPLKGVPRFRPIQMHNTAKNQRRPERPFGGQLCSKCSRLKIKELNK